MSATSVQDAIDLIRMEYAEMPDLQLTFRQAQRLWNLSTAVCERALAALTQAGVLVCNRNGGYIREVGAFASHVSDSHPMDPPSSRPNGSSPPSCSVTAPSSGRHAVVDGVW